MTTNKSNQHCMDYPTESIAACPAFQCLQKVTGVKYIG